MFFAAPHLVHFAKNDLGRLKTTKLTLSETFSCARGQFSCHDMGRPCGGGEHDKAWKYFCFLALFLSVMAVCDLHNHTRGPL